MLNIVIIGAGDVGYFIAQMLSKEDYNITLIDKDQKRLDEVSWNLDVAVRCGSGTDWQLLDELLELSPHILIALTDIDEVNLVACDIGKHLGYPRTIARVKDNLYLNKSRLDFAHLFDVDYFVGPELLAANDIFKYMVHPGSLAVEHFAHGAVQLRAMTVPTRWRRYDKSLKEMNLPKGMIVGLIAREREDRRRGGGTGIRDVIFPHGDDHIFPGDEVTIIGEADVISNAHQFFGISQRVIHSVCIVGGTLTAVHLAKLLKERNIDVRIIEKDYEQCCRLAEQLNNCTIMNHDGTDFEFLRAEKIGNVDVFVGCTHNDEVNFLAALLGKEVGCEDAIVMLSNMSYAPLASRLGINYTVSPRVSTANHILSQILSGTVTTLISLYENQAEVMEINVSLDSKLVGIPLADLGPLLPTDFLIAMIQNRGRIMVANGARIISPGDTVIVITNPKHVHELEQIF